MSQITMDTPAIDVHAHVGAYNRGSANLRDEWYSGGADAVVTRGRAVAVERSIVSSIPAIMPHGGDTVAGNRTALADVETHGDLCLWAVLNPLQEASFPQVDELLAHPKCVGIKIHPSDHGYEIRDHGDRLFDFAAERNAVVLTHSGQTGSFPEDFVAFANRFNSVTLILAHLGNSDDDSPTLQVDAARRCDAGNVYVDTSSAASVNAGLIEWAVRQLGHDRLLFGTDSPLYHVASQKARLVYADIPDPAKRAILHHNAARLFGW